jgi:hypothetical protein
VVRGPQDAVEQVRDWLAKMGETEMAEGGMVAGGNVRVVPLSGWAGKSALERLQQIWPSMRTNRIRVVTPSAAIPEIRASDRAEPLRTDEEAMWELLFGTQSGLPQSSGQTPDIGQRDLRQPPRLRATPESGNIPEIRNIPSLRNIPDLQEVPNLQQLPPRPLAPELPRPRPAPPAALPETGPTGSGPADAPEREAKSAGGSAPRAKSRSPFVFASDMRSAEPGAEDSEAPRAATTPQDVKPPQPEAQATPPTSLKPPQQPKPPAEIIVAPGPGGIMIASEDVEALNAFEDLLTALGSGPLSGTSDLTIFYLVHVQNTVVAQVLDQVFGGGTLADSGGSQRGSLAEDLAGAAFGDAGALVGSLLGLGGGGSTIAPSGSVQIIPTDSRLNGLIVRANPTDTETIRQLLEILDRPGSPEEVLAQPKPRLIPVSNTQAEEIAEVVREVYQENLAAGSSRGRPPSPVDVIQALRGSRGRGGSSRGSTEQVEKMSLGVDVRTNSLVVSAPDPLFQEVKQLVEQLDAAALGSSSQTMQVVTLKKSNAEKVQEALESLVGENVTFGSSGPTSRRTSTGGPRPGGSPMDEFRRQMMMRAMQGGGGPPGFGGFRPPGSFGRGGSSRGGGSSPRRIQSPGSRGRR